MRHRARIARVPLQAATIGLLCLCPSHAAAQSSRSPASLHLANPVILTVLPATRPAPTPAEIIERAAEARRIDGTFFGEYTSSAEPGAVFRGVLRLTQGGHAVSGSFLTNTGRTAELSGRIDGDRLEITLVYNDGCPGSSRLSARTSHGDRRLTGSYRTEDCHGSYSGELILRARDAAPSSIRRAPVGLAGPGDPSAAREMFADVMVSVEGSIARESLETAAASHAGPDLRIYEAPRLPASLSVTENQMLGAVRFSAARALLVLSADEIELDRALGEGVSTVVTAVLYDARTGDAVWSGARAYVAEPGGEGTGIEPDPSVVVVRAVDSVFDALREDGVLPWRTSEPTEP